MNTSEGCSDIYDWRFLVNFKAEFLCIAFSKVFTIEEDTVTCQLPDDNSGILGMDAISMDESIII